MEKAWLYLEPYTCLTLNSVPEILLYNTLNGQQFRSRDAEIVNLLARWQAPEEGHVVAFTPAPAHLPLLDWLKATFSGDVIADTGANPKPVQFAPLEAMTEKRLRESRAKMGENPSSLEIFFYLNARCEGECAFCGTYHKQFPFCKKAAHASAELGIEDIAGLIDQLDPGRLQTLHFLGGNLLAYTGLETLLDYLRRIPTAKEFYLPVCQVPCPEALDAVGQTGARLHLLAGQASDGEKAVALGAYLASRGYEYLIDRVVTGEDEMEAALAAEEQPTCLHPFYTGHNLSFFEEHVFISAEDFHQPVSLRKLYKHRLMNDSFFGKILIDVDGRIYLSPNRPAIGALSQGIAEAMEKILAPDSLWFLTRDKVQPCGDCVYNRLCCPISDYELGMQKFNLCREQPPRLQNN